MITVSNKKDIINFIREDLNREYNSICENMTEHVNVIFTDILRKLSKKDFVVNFMMKLKDYNYNTYIHSIRVGVYSIIIGFILGNNEKFLIEIGAAGLLHDIGKIGVPIEIINKKDKLDQLEFNIIQSHVSRSTYDIKKNYHFENENIILGVYQHHERTDGSGYPRQLMGDEISIPGRILAVADVFEAYSSERSYHEARTVKQTINFMAALNGIDKKILNRFISYMNEDTGKIQI